MILPQLFKLFWQYVKEQYFPLRRKKSKEEDRDIDLILQGSLTPTADGPAQTVCDESEFSCPEDETMTRIRVEFDEVDLGATTTAPEVEFEICGISECASPTPSTATPRTPLSKSPSFFGAPPTMNQAAHNAAATMKKDEDEYGNERADTMLEKSRLQALIKPILLTVVFLLACGLLYTEAEGWDFGVACYFWFITFSTIGEEPPVRSHSRRLRSFATCSRRL